MRKYLILILVTLLVSTSSQSQERKKDIQPKSGKMNISAVDMGS